VTRAIVTACMLLLAAGSFADASERIVVREESPAVVISQFSQAIPPELPVVGELPGVHRMAAGAQCCRMKTSGAAGTPCSCCQHPPARANTKNKK
jgi:hypothetical protein